METLSFVLGIAFVVVIAVAIVAVYAFVKVSKLEQGLDEVIRRTDLNTSNVYRDLGDIREGIYRDMDSRHDSLVSITWINMVKEAEQARINQSKFDIDLTEDILD